ncbi:uncharacterized protein JCM6883_001418 [Sporobolomyces salmoneus]|uniref:uncharacterized protein n=1 Tax=Sporobolomyces salmoneus TaxID=183962 RepID=UPI00317B90F3
MQYSTASAFPPTPQAFSPPNPRTPLASHSQSRPSHPRIPTTTAGTGTGAAPSIRTTGGSSALVVQDPMIEAKKGLALLLGTSQGVEGGERSGGLIDKLENEATSVLDCVERAFEAGTPPPDLESMYSTLDILISLLSRSALGGYSEKSLANPPLISTGDLERVTKGVQGLFREVQRCKEGAEIARVGLSG